MEEILYHITLLIIYTQKLNYFVNGKKLQNLFKHSVLWK